MNGSFNVPDNGIGEDSNNDRGTFNNGELSGTITSHIGTGQNAKDSFIWMTITWSFYIASGISLLLFIRSCFNNISQEDLLGSITSIWSVFIPIITLALGYAFGKGK